MITANLYRTHEVGHVVRLPDHSTLLRVVRELGPPMDYLLGGKGIRLVELEPVEDEKTTSELSYINGN